MHKTSFYIINVITIYRALAAFLLLFLIIKGDNDWFKWLLAFSFFTDAIDGFLARKYKIVSVMGSRLDSVADDLTILMAIIGIVVFKNDFVWEHLPLIFILVGLYFLQLIIALIRYGKPTSFHTYLAKGAMCAQGIFFILLFFLPHYPLTWFYIAAAITILDLSEEIVLALILPKWQADVKGLYWVKKKQRHQSKVPA